MSTAMQNLWEGAKQGQAPKKWAWLESHRVIINPDHREMVKKADLDTIQGMLRCHEGEVVSQDRKQEKNEVRRLHLEHGGRRYTLFLKRYFNYMPGKIWKRAFRGSYFPPSMVKAEYCNLMFLRQLGIHVPEPVAYGEHRVAGAIVNAYLVTLEIPEAMGLDYMIREWLPLQPVKLRRKYRTQLIQHMADVLRTMHRHGFEHHDLFFRNLMASGADLSRLYVFDAPRGMRWPGWIMRFRRVQDLATLDAAATLTFRRSERLRFLFRYLGRTRLTPRDKNLIRRIVKMATPLRRRQISRLDRAVKIEEEWKTNSVCAAHGNERE